MSARKSPAEIRLHSARPHPAVGDKPSAFAPGRAKAPLHLCEAARVEFKRVSKILGARGTETQGDFLTLTLYAEVYSRWVEAKDALRKEGLRVDVTILDSHGEPVTSKRMNPLLKVCEACESRLLALAKSMGLSPDSREKTKPVGKREPPGPPQPGTLAFHLLHGGKESESDDRHFDTQLPAPGQSEDSD